jgi:hypothetical protein
LITYNENKIEFSQSEVLETLSKVAQLEGIQLNGIAFLDDLLNALCILQRDGLQIVFSHRSFQEYFCSYRLMRFPEQKVAELIARFASRDSDNVLPMLFDMDSRLVNRTYIYPTLKRYKEVTENIGYDFKVTKFLRLLGAGVSIRQLTLSSIYLTVEPETNEFLRLRTVVMRAYRNISEQYFWFNAYLVNRADYHAFRATVIPSMGKISQSTEAHYVVETGWTEIKYTGYTPRRGDRVVCSEETLGAVIFWMDNSSLSDQIEREHREMLKLCTELEQEQKSKSKSLNEILGIST